MDVKWKTIENIKAKIDITLYYDHQNMELLNDKACVTTFIATFAFDKKAQFIVYKWLKSL